MRTNTLILFCILSLTGSSFAQTYNDTLYFKSGLERPASIYKYDYEYVRYFYLNSKGEQKEVEARVKQLKYYVVYDSLGNLEFSSKDKANEEKMKPKEDSISMSRHLLSVNPFSVPLLGINVDYTKRLGPSMKWGIHVPVRLVGLLLTQGSLFGYVGVGATYFLTNNERASFVARGTVGFYLVDGGAAMSIPLSLGFVRYLTDFWAVSGFLGIGPGFDLEGNGFYAFPMPTAHLGVTFQLGEKEIIQGY